MEGITTINDKLCVIDGWIVDKEKHAVVSLRSLRQNLTAEEKDILYNIKDVRVLKNIDIAHDVRVASSSKQLFDYISTQDIAFVKLPGRIVVKNSWPHNRAKKSVTEEFSLSCHPVSIGGPKKCYLYYYVPEEVAEWELSFLQGPRPILSRDNTVYSTLIKVQEFEFTKRDFNIVKDLITKNDNAWKYECGQMMMAMKFAASENARGYFARSYHRGIDNFIKNLQPATLKEYGSRISLLVLILKCCDKFSFFDKYRSTAAMVAGKLRNIQIGKDLADRVGRLVSNLSEGGGDDQFWKVWVFLGAFDFCLWEDWGADRPTVPILKYRYTLDSLSWVFRYGAVNFGHDIGEIIIKWTSSELGAEDFVGNIKKLYYEVSKEAIVAGSTNVTVSHKRRDVVVKNRVLSFDIIGATLRDLTKDFDSYTVELAKWVSFGSINELHFNTIGSLDATFKEDDGTQLIWLNFGLGIFKRMKMKWRVAQNKTNPGIISQVKDLVSKLNKAIMLMVWVSTGMPMRFPELATLTYAGFSRNIYIDVAERRLYLNVKYNKNHKFTNRTLFITDGVSRRLWWTITILRFFILETFKEESVLYDRSVFLRELNMDVARSIDTEEYIVDPEDNLDDEVRRGDTLSEQVLDDINNNNHMSSAVIKMFVFVDIKNHRLFDLRQFTNLLKSYPKEHNDKQNHSISTWRQGLAALWKHFIIPKINLGAESIISEGFGNSKETFSGFYGVDSRFAEGNELAFEEMSLASGLFHEAIGATVAKKLITVKREEEVILGPPMDNYDLDEAGKIYFNNERFEFKSAEQGKFMNMVLMSNRKVAGLQAATAFGKSLTFTLPMMVVKMCSKEHYINFICVPYQSLKIATINKLEKGGLTVRDMGFFSREDVGTILGSVDVFVGCSESFADGKISHILKNWDMIYGGRFKLGYLVFDEAHTLFLESSFRPAMKNIRDLAWLKWRKALFLSATMGERMYKRILDDIKMPGSIKKNALYVNCIEQVPIVPVESDVRMMRSDEIIPAAVELVNKFINSTSNAKAVFFFSDKGRLRAVGRHFNLCNAVGAVDADAKDSDKREIFASFEDVNSERRVVMGTKLLSNGLDCKSVQLICLVGCSLNCVDYLQMVGRIRDWGLVVVLANENYKPHPKNTEISRLFPEIDWKQCVSKQVAEYYNVPYEGHDGCCGVTKVDGRIEALKRKLFDGNGWEEQPEGDEMRGHSDTTRKDESNNNAASNDDYEDDNRAQEERRDPTTECLNEEEPVIQDNHLTRAIKKLLLKKGDETYVRNWKDLLEVDYNLQSTRELLLNIDPRFVVTWDGTISPSLCDICLMPIHDEPGCGVLPAIVGKLVYEYLAIEKVLKSKEEYGQIRNELIKKTGGIFLIYVLNRQINRARTDFIKLNEVVSRFPRFVGDNDKYVNNPIGVFSKYFQVIIRRKINVVLLLLRKTVEYSTQTYDNMSRFVASVFADSANITNAVEFDDTAMFAIYKKEVLTDAVAWLLWYYELHHETGLVKKFIQDMKNMPVVVTMIWIVFENKKYKDILKSITLDHFECADTFPVFAKYMASIVKYNGERCPLFVVFLGIELDNIAALNREERLSHYSITRKL